MANGYQSAAELRKEISSSDSSARRFISVLFDEGTFLETGTYTKNAGGNNNFEGVITGCGAVDGRLVFTFIQDYSNGRAAFTSASAKKISALYDKAIRAKAPVVGVYTSAGAKLSEGIDAVSGYGAVIARISEAKSLIPQISVVAGACGGAAAAAASMADFVVADNQKGELYILPENEATMKQGVRADLYAEGTEALALRTRELLNYLPGNREEGTVYTLAPDDINTPSEGIEALASSDSDIRELISALSDNGVFFELFSDFDKEMVCGFSAINGRIVGVTANQPIEKKGALTANAARKAAKFINFLGRFGIPLLTLVNTVGFGGENCGCYAGALSELCFAYTSCKSAKITVVTGKAYGSAFTLLGSKQLGADMVFALDSAVISVMAPETAVEFVWDNRVKAAADPVTARATLRDEWIASSASPLAAARLGDIDDVIEYSELRQRVAAAFEIF